MASKPPDHKRKRGRPPGASKLTENAPSGKHSEVTEPDAEDDARPKKRGRKAVPDISAPIPSLEERVEPAQPRKRGRPAHGQARGSEAEAETKRKAAARPMNGRAKAEEARVDADPPSSEPRRSGRDKRPLNLDKPDGARPPNLSPTQFTSPPSDSSRMLAPPRRKKRIEPEPPGSIPRRSARERRVLDAETVSSGNRQNIPQDKGPTPVVERRKGWKRANAPQAQEEEAATMSRKQKHPAQGKAAEGANAPGKEPSTRKNRPAVQQSTTKMKLPPRELRPESPGEGSSRSRKKKATKATDEVAAPVADATQPKRRGRKGAKDRIPQESEASELPESRGPRREEKAQMPATGPSRRRSPLRQGSEPGDEQDADTESEEDDEEVPYRYIKETIRNVPRSTIVDKWTPLDPPAISAVSAFFAASQLPVILCLQSTSQQRGHASAALGAITRRLRNRLLKGFPFPAPTTSTSTRANAGSYEDDFNLERTLDAKQTLENVLNPLLHSVSLLEREISKEEGALARDYDLLHRLEANAKSAAHEWRDKAKREHILAPGIRKKDEREAESRDRLELVPAVEDGLSGGLFKDLEDQDLVTLSQQIGSHMQSMKDNLQQIDGVVPAITQGKAALQQVLLRHLDDEQYENVLLG
ncbi:unnamed protein product [Discula destructiva]